MLRQGGNAADAAADDYADPVGIILAWLQPGLLAGLAGGYRGELGETVHPPGFFALQIILGVETLYLGAETGIETLGVKGGEIVNAGAPLRYALPS